jgi:hypothetical protein
MTTWGSAVHYLTAPELSSDVLSILAGYRRDQGILVDVSRMAALFLRNSVTVVNLRSWPVKLNRNDAPLSVLTPERPRIHIGDRKGLGFFPIHRTVYAAQHRARGKAF